MPDADRALAGPPDRDVPVPDAVTALAGGRTVVPVWQNEVGGITYDVGTGGARVFVKWSPAGRGPDLAVEAERLTWAAHHIVVPRVVDCGRDDDGSWLVTEALPGVSAVAPEWLADPTTAVTAIGRGLRALHDELPVDECPWSWSVADRGGDAREAPPVDRLVVCHGDACAPNTLVGDDGSWIGHVDLGRLGVADRWADLAVATWSTVWNYGPGYEDLLLAEYGIAPDPECTAFYRRLWDLGSGPERGP
jgi:kanamycin kinase